MRVVENPAKLIYEENISIITFSWVEARWIGAGIKHNWPQEDGKIFSWSWCRFHSIIYHIL